MKWSNEYKLRLVLVGVVTSIIIGSGSAKADFTFGEPTNLGSPVNDFSEDGSPNISADGAELFFDSTRSGGSGNYDLWVAMRATIDDNWEAPSNLGSTVNSSSFDGQPEISADGLSLFFASDRSGGQGDADIWITIRPVLSDPWGTPMNLGPTVNSSARDWSPSITADGLSLFFCSERSGGYGAFDIWVTTRTSTEDPWGQPVNLGPTVNSSVGESYVNVSANGLSLFFSEYTPPFRTGGFGGGDLWITTRAKDFDPWRTPVNLGPSVNTGFWEVSSDVSTDGSNFYFCSDRAGGKGALDLYQVLISPVVDLNADGIVDSADMCVIVDYWGTDESLCDIGPTPLGDGIIDVQDLIVLAEHLFTYPGAVACWKLDETKGNIAYDSIGDNDGTINGDPAWQPGGGMVDGALQFDGIDDYVSTEFVVNPAEGAFSMFVWIKGGAPGQVVLSQKGGVSWLCTDASEGNLMTELKGLGRSAAALLSQTVITDGNWHRIGLVWDGSQRTLYVDGVAVAEDIQDGMEGSDSGLYIGTGKAMESETFWSGLIDDVRIYSRVVRP